jgi:hypothetical protein
MRKNAKNAKVNKLFRGSKIRNIPNFGRIRENLANANIELSRNYGSKKIID